MSEHILRKVRADVEALLAQPTADLDAKHLFSMIQGAIASENAARDQAHGARSTFGLNGLLAAELAMWTQVFGMPRRPIVAGA